MNDERDIEKQLREYAKQRRQDAGDTPPLHPATRNLLQGEVTRLRGSARSRHGHGRFSWQHFLFGSMNRIVASLSTAAAVVLIGFLVLRNPGRPKFEQFAANNEPAKQKDQEVRRERDDSSLSDLNRQLGDKLGTSLADNRSKTGSAAPALSTAPILSLDQPTGGAGIPAMQPAIPAAAPPVTPAPTTPPPTLASAATSTAATATTAVPAELFASKAIAGPAEASTVAGPLAKNYVRAQAPADALLKEVDARDKVLNNFRVEQNGGELRIIDADGSVYTGSVTLAGGVTPAQGNAVYRAREETKTEAAATTVNEPARVAVTTPVPTNAATRASNATFAESGAATNYSFRVSGTNLSLGQPIEFAGTFSPEPPSPLGGRAGRGGAAGGGGRRGGGGGGGGGARPAQTGVAIGGGGFATNTSTNAFASNRFVGASGALTNNITNTNAAATLFRIQGEATVGDSYRLQINAR
jgi:hypothetical protein